MNRCHHDKGVRLDECDRAVLCKVCGRELDPFEALQHYAASEQRLLQTWRHIKENNEREASAKAREKERRPFLRKVLKYMPKKDLTLKAEPIIGYVLDLECGHKAECGPNRKVKTKTCYQCQMTTGAPVIP